MALSLKNSRNCQSNDKVTPFLNRLVAVGVGNRVITNVTPSGQLLPPTEYEKYVDTEQWSKVRHDRSRDLVLTFGEDEVRVFKRTKAPADKIVKVEHEEEVKTLDPNGVTRVHKVTTTKERVAVSGLETVPLPKELVISTIAEGNKNSANVTLLGGIHKLDGTIATFDSTHDTDKEKSQPQPPSPNAAAAVVGSGGGGVSSASLAATQLAASGYQHQRSHSNESRGGSDRGGGGGGGLVRSNTLNSNASSAHMNGATSVNSNAMGARSLAASGMGNTNVHSPNSGGGMLTAAAASMRVGGSLANSAANGGGSQHPLSLLDPNAPPPFIPAKMWQQWIHLRCKEKDPEGPTAILDRLHAEAAAAYAKKMDGSRRRRRHHRITCIYHLKSTNTIARKMGRARLFPTEALHQSHFRVQHAIHGATIHEDKQREDGGDDAEKCFVVPDMCEVVSVFATPAPHQQTTAPSNANASSLGGNASMPSAGNGMAGIPELSIIRRVKEDVEEGDAEDGDTLLPSALRRQPTTAQVGGRGGGDGANTATTATPAVDSSLADAVATAAVISSGVFSMTQPTNIGGGRSSYVSRACTPNLAPFEQKRKRKGARKEDEDSGAMSSLLSSQDNSRSHSPNDDDDDDGFTFDCSCSDRSTDDEEDLGAAIAKERAALKHRVATRLLEERRRKRAAAAAKAQGSEGHANGAGGGGDEPASLEIINGEASSEAQRREQRYDERSLLRSAPEPMLSDKAAHALQYWQDRFRKATIEGCAKLKYRLEERERQRAFVSNERTHLHLLSRQAERAAREISLIRQTRSSTPAHSSAWAPVFNSIEGDRRYMAEAQEQFISFCDFCAAKQFPSTDEEMQFILDLRNMCVIDAASRPSSRAFLEASLAPTFRKESDAAAHSNITSRSHTLLPMASRASFATDSDQHPPLPATFNPFSVGTANNAAPLTAACSMIGGGRSGSRLLDTSRRNDTMNNNSNNMMIMMNSSNPPPPSRHLPPSRGGLLAPIRSGHQGGAVAPEGLPPPPSSSSAHQQRYNNTLLMGNIMTLSRPNTRTSTSGGGGQRKHSSRVSTAGGISTSAGGVPSGGGGGGPSLNGVSAAYTARFGSGGGGIALYDGINVSNPRSLFHSRNHTDDPAGSGSGSGGGGGGIGALHHRNSMQVGANASGALSHTLSSSSSPLRAGGAAASFNRFNEETAMALLQVYGPMLASSRGGVAVANHLREECKVSSKDFLQLFYSHEDEWGSFCPEMAVLKKRLNQSSL